ncbi:MAG: lysophospholipid acyltransferase family protein [Candidatus Accumulibacter sp.]|nr:lysophospholipid acyltransferase family protein [Accumulibacter sp.]
MIRLFRFLSHFPLCVLHALGAVTGYLTWLASPTYRRHLRENSALALGAQGARRIRSAVVSHAGKSTLELPKIWLRPLDEVLSHIRHVEGAEVSDAAWRAGKGVIYLTPHLGCFEITAQYLSRRMPLTVLYRPPRQAWLQTLMETGRTRPQMSLASADLRGVRALMKALKRNEAVGLLPDQAPKAGEGRWIDFFGKPAYTMTLAARLSESGASIVLVWAKRLPRGQGFELRFQSPSRPICGTTEERARKINREIEKLILQCPEQYLWGYNRYKRSRGAGQETGDRGQGQMTEDRR